MNPAGAQSKHVSIEMMKALCFQLRSVDEMKEVKITYVTLTVSSGWF